MAANPNYKCRFFKAELDQKSGRIVCFMLPDQPPYRDSDTGNMVQWDTSLMVITSDYNQSSQWQEGEIYAAAQIEFVKKNTNNYYVVKGEAFRVVDEDGILITDGGGNANHEAAIELYDKYSSGTGNAPTGATTKAHTPRTLTELEKVKADKRFDPPVIEKDGFWVSDSLWYDLVMCARHNVSVLLLGPKGTGKTELIELVATKLGHQFDGFDMSIQNPYSYLCGNTRLNDKGETEFQYARFAKQVQTTQPAIMLLDELSRCAPTASNILLPVLDRRRTLFIENAIDEDQRVIPIGEKVTFWATANMGAEYLGVAGLDEALFDRFVVMETSYPPKAVEAKLLKVRCGLERRESELIAKFAEQVRNHKDIATKISTRKVLEVGQWVSWGYSIVDAVERVALSIWPSDDIDGGERTAVKAIMQMLN